MVSSRMMQAKFLTFYENMHLMIEVIIISWKENYRLALKIRSYCPWENILKCMKFNAKISTDFQIKEKNWTGS
jgi:hypothetical protein